jgi:hypothetical protein
MDADKHLLLCIYGLDCLTKVSSGSLRKTNDVETRYTRSLSQKGDIFSFSEGLILMEGDGEG